MSRKKEEEDLHAVVKPFLVRFLALPHLFLDLFS